MSDRDRIQSVVQAAMKKDQDEQNAAMAKEKAENEALNARRAQVEQYGIFQACVEDVLNQVNGDLAPTGVRLMWVNNDVRSYPMTSDTPIGQGSISAQHSSKLFKNRVDVNVNAKGSVSIVHQADKMQEPTMLLVNHDNNSILKIVANMVERLGLA